MTFYTFANATTAIPLANLDANFATPITLGNTAVTINGTFSSIGNLTLNNANITSVAATFPNSFLANSTTTIGNTTVTLGSTSSSIGNLTLNNVTVASGTATVTSLTTGSVSNSGNETFTGTGARFLADFTNATVTNRLAFQTSTANSTTGIYALPNGTSTAASWQATNAADPTNASKILIATNGSTDVQLVSGINGTGTYLPLSFYTNGSERMRIDISGNVGIGTSSPQSSLHVKGTVGGAPTATGIQMGINGGYAGIEMSNTTGGWLDFNKGDGTDFQGRLFYDNANNVMQFYTNAAERMRIDSNGTVSIGTTQGGTGFGLLNVQRNASSSQSSLSIGDFNTVSNDVGIYLRTSTNAGISWTSGGYLAFYRGGPGVTESMRIDASGNLLVGTTTQVGKLNVVASSNIGAGYTQYLRNTWSGDVGYPGIYLAKYDNNTTTSQIFVRFSVNNETTASGQINANGANSAAFGSFSDRRLKENIVDLSSQLANICSLRPAEFDFKDGSGHQIGFIAQEMQEVYPDVVGVGADDMLTITGWSKTEARLVKAIQELKAEFDAYKASHA